MYIYWSHAAMMVRWMIFGEIVGQIGCSWFPKHAVVALVDYIFYPIEPHVQCFDYFFMDGVICYPLHSGVIYLHGNCLLWVSHFLKGDYDWFPCFGIVKQWTPSSSAADGIKFCMMLESVRIYPLDLLVLLKLWDPKKNGLLHDF